MQPQIITVHDIQEAIEDVGIVPYANTIVQELGGGYFFVDAEEIEDSINVIQMWALEGWATDCHTTTEIDENGDVVKIPTYYRYKVHPIPNKIAYFIIQALQLKSRMAQLGIPPASEIYEGSQAVYLTPGTEIFGHKVEELTEIKAELRPVVVERL